jgi:hypothetical protein
MERPTLGSRITRRRPSAVAEAPAKAPQVPVVAPRRIAVAKRLSSGRAHFASVLNWWLARCNYSHTQIGAIADWALAHDGWLISSQISHLRNNHIQRPSFTNLEALAAVNQVLALWHVEGPRETFHQHGPFSDPNLTEELLERGECLKHPTTDEPLDFAGFCELFVGRIKLQQASVIDFLDHDAKRISEELGILLDDLAASSGLSPRDAIAQVLLHYPCDDRKRCERLKAVMLGTEVYTPQQVREEMFSLSELVRAFRGLPEGTYGPEELLAELTKHRQRT